MDQFVPYPQDLIGVLADRLAAARALELGIAFQPAELLGHGLAAAGAGHVNVHVHDHGIHTHLRRQKGCRSGTPWEKNTPRANPSKSGRKADRSSPAPYAPAYSTCRRRPTSPERAGQ